MAKRLASARATSAWRAREARRAHLARRRQPRAQGRARERPGYLHDDYLRWPAQAVQGHQPARHGRVGGNLDQKDLEDLKVALEHNVDFIALSFVRRAEIFAPLRRYIEAANSNAKMISKIERPEAVENLEEIVRESYAVMVARGDLGVELGPEGCRLTRSASSPSPWPRSPGDHRDADVGVDDHQPAPTRAEASDVANAIWDGPRR